MFNRTVSLSNQLNEANAENAKLREAIEKLIKRPMLISIDREGRTNKFTFVRGETVTVIETYSTMADDLPGWKRALLEDN